MFLFLIFIIAATGGYDLAFFLFIVYLVFCFIDGEDLFMGVVWFIIFNMIFDDPNEIKTEQQNIEIIHTQDPSDISENPNLVNGAITIQPEVEKLETKLVNKNEN